MDSVTTNRPWGSFTRFTNNEESTVKLLYVNKDEKLSLQYHNKREEFWKVIEGNPEITVGDKVVLAQKGDEFFIEKKVNHRISAPENNVIILEISKGEFDEEDIVRLDDKYNRVK
jgi:mannose-6-phosphate isomerase-like protein (cupin superfamily)